jgi:hypothetical protein
VADDVKGMAWHVMFTRHVRRCWFTRETRVKTVVDDVTGMMWRVIVLDPTRAWVR